MPRNARDHYRPILHLRHFTDDVGLLWTYDRSGRVAPFQQSAPNIGFEKGLYTVVEPPDEDAAAFENWLNEEIDGPAASALEAAATEPKLAPKVRSALSVFIAAQDLRTPRAKKRVLSLYRAGLDGTWTGWRSKPDELAAAIARDHGVRHDPAAILEMLDQYQFDVTTNAWLDFIQSMINKVGERIHRMRWLRVYSAEGVDFVTSDVGIVKCDGRADAFTSWDMGFTRGRSVWVFPLKPEVSLVITPEGAPARSGPGKAEWIQKVNRDMWNDADRWVFSRHALPLNGPVA